MPNLTTPEAVVRSILAATDANDVPALAGLLTDDVHLTFASAETTVGQEALLGNGPKLPEVIAGMPHKIHALWTVEDNVVMTEMTVHYERRDGRKVSLPCANSFRVRDGRVRDYRIYMDIAPVFAGSTSATAPGVPP